MLSLKRERGSMAGEYIYTLTDLVTGATCTLDEASNVELVKSWIQANVDVLNARIAVYPGDFAVSNT